MQGKDNTYYAGEVMTFGDMEKRSNFIVKALTICTPTKYKFVLSTNDNEQLFALYNSPNLEKPVDFAAIFH